MIDPARLYRAPWSPADFVRLKANLVLVEPIMPPERARGTAGLYLPNQAKEIIPTTATAFRVLKVSDQLVDEPAVHFDAASALDVKAGDEVVVRNGMLEPVHVSGTPLLLHRRHVLAHVDHVEGPLPAEEATP